MSFCPYNIAWIFNEFVICDSTIYVLYLLNVPKISSHCSKNIVPKISLSLQQHCPYNNIVPKISLSLQQHCPYNIIVPKISCTFVPIISCGSSMRLSFVILQYISYICFPSQKYHLIVPKISVSLNIMPFCPYNTMLIFNKSNHKFVPITPSFRILKHVPDVFYVPTIQSYLLH